MLELIFANNNFRWSGEIKIKLEDVADKADPNTVTGSLRIGFGTSINGTMIDFDVDLLDVYDCGPYSTGFIWGDGIYKPGNLMLALSEDTLYTPIAAFLNFSGHELQHPMGREFGVKGLDIAKGPISELQNISNQDLYLQLDYDGIGVINLMKVGTVKHE